MKRLRILIVVFALSIPLTGYASCKNTVILSGDVVTMLERDAIFKGQILICDELIQEVKLDHQAWNSLFNLEDTKVIQLGFIYPGMINLHDHSAYNFLPLWNPPQRYDNRYQWARAGRYKTEIKDPYNLLTDNKYYAMTLEVAKYDELKSIVGGTTSTQGSPNRNGINDWLVRNVDLKNFGSDNIYSRTLAITDTRFDPSSLKQRAAASTLDAWFIHLAEGVDSSSRDEFDLLKSIGLLHDWTVIIHGTALGKNEFSAMARAGAKLVWSPFSNLLLYGDTTRVDYALAENIPVSLATDWSPSGSKNLLGEIKVAWEINKQNEDLPDYEPFDTFQLVQMVTTNPAKALRWQNKVGQIKAGMYADIMAFSKVSASSKTPELNPSINPYDALVRATEKDVELVMVGGDAVYGGVNIIKTLKPDDYEVISITHLINKAIDVTKVGIHQGEQSFKDLQEKLSSALKFNPDHMFQHFKVVSDKGWSRSEFGQWIDEDYSHVSGMTLDPLFTLSDANFFKNITAVSHSNIRFDLQDLYYSPLHKTLQLVNHPLVDDDYLYKAVGISMRAAKNIVAYKAGLDRKLNTVDDRMFQSVDELDLVKYVGPSTLDKMHLFASSWQMDNPIQVADPIVNFINRSDTTFVLLDVVVGLRRDAAQNLISRRNGVDKVFGTNDDQLFMSQKDIQSVKGVGVSAFKKIEKYLESR